MSGGGGLSPEQQRLFELLASREAPEPVSDPDPLLPLGAAAERPLSFAQERIWLLDRFEPGNPALNMPVLLRLAGELRPPCLERAFDRLLERHEVLRTRFEAVEGLPRPRLDPPRPRPLPLVDLAGLATADREAEADRLGQREVLRPFDLEADLPVRYQLLRFARREHRLLLTLHHVACDGWSTAVITGELGELYRAFSAGEEPRLAELAVQYADYAAWQRRRLNGERLEELLGYWRRRLEGMKGALELPADHPRPALQSYRGARLSRRLPAELSAAVRSLARARGATLFMALLAAFEVLLQRWTGESDLAVGTPIAGRERAELEGLVGIFLNTLVLRTDLSDPEGSRLSFEALLARVRETTLGAYAHQELPFERLLDELQPERDLSRTPLFQVFFNMLSFPARELTLPGLRLERLDAVELAAKLDLTLYVEDPGHGDEAGGGIGLELLYNADLFAAPRMEELLAQYQLVLEQVSARPERPIAELSLLSASARRLLPDPSAELDASWRGAIHELFLRRADEHPDRTAVADSEGALSYRQLAGLSAHVARDLAAAGVERGDRVAIYAHRSAPLVVAILGVLRAGAAFIVLDPLHPASRAAQAVRLARPRAWLAIAASGPPPAELAAALTASSGRRAVELPPRERWGALAAGPDRVPSVPVGPDDLAYVAFTSGSTGEPKGILGRHGPLTHFAPWQAEVYGFGPEDRFSMLSGLAHDPLQRDVFTPLGVGAAVVVPEAERLLEPGWLAGWMAREGITVSHLTPAMGQVLSERRSGAPRLELPALRWVFFVGDVLTRRDVARLRRLAPGVRCINHYGATESQRAVAFHRAGEEEGDGGEVLPLGRGVPGVQLLIANRVGGLAGVGELGEIAIRSPHLAAGYLGDPALTAERFVPPPVAGGRGERVYLTGDLGRYRPDGEVTFAGRADRQVQVRGYRVEPGEIEAALGRLPEVAEAAVDVREGAAGAILVAWIVPARGEVDLDAVREALAGRLPRYMVPALLTTLDRLPITANGKVDRSALIVPEGERSGLEAGFVEPRDALEQQLAAIWAEVLGVERVGVQDSFFALGGDSLLATRVAARIEDRIDVSVPLRAFFTTPTVSALAEEVRSAQLAALGADARALVEQVEDLSEAELEAELARLEELAGA